MNNEVCFIDGDISPLERRRQYLCNEPNLFAADPQYSITLNDGHYPEAIVDGYQHFQIRKNSNAEIEITPLSDALRQKDIIMSPILKSLVPGLSVLDVGGNYGYFCAKSMEYGAAGATLVDMDRKYTDIARKIYSHIGQPFSSIDIKNNRLRDISNDSDDVFSSDVVIALALIHWSYNCSESRGSLAKTIGSLALRAKKVLIIEWIDPADAAIQNENHLGLGGTFAESTADNFKGEVHITNTSLISRSSSPYMLDEFLRVMKRVFWCVTELGIISPTRRIFIGVRCKGRHQTGDHHLDSAKYTRVNEWTRHICGC